MLVVLGMTKKSTGNSTGSNSNQKSFRGRLMARIAGAAAIGVQFLPNSEQLHEGLQLAAVVLLATDVSMDVLGGLWALVRQACAYIREAKAIWRSEMDGSIVVGVKIPRAATVPRAVVWITGRVTSSLLALLSGKSEQPHLLLAAAFVIVVLDSVVEVAKLVGDRVRAHLG
ncbi:hypothetical protein [Streptomyces sp. NPDC001315]|uniref:hypothetical protein n=1 Tax=Streptomyces sp. NPDC001315 TaxID=3364562 RepID=UPI00367E8E04